MGIPSTRTQATDNCFLSLKLEYITSTDANFATVLETSDDTNGFPDRGGKYTQRRG